MNTLDRAHCDTKPSIAARILLVGLIAAGCKEANNTPAHAAPVAPVCPEIAVYAGELGAECSQLTRQICDGQCIIPTLTRELAADMVQAGHSIEDAMRSQVRGQCAQLILANQNGRLARRHNCE